MFLHCVCVLSPEVKCRKTFLYFIKGWFDGITIYCSDGNSIYKYNATMLTYLVACKPLFSSQTIHQIPNIQLDHFLTYTDNNEYVK